MILFSTFRIPQNLYAIILWIILLLSTYSATAKGQDIDFEQNKYYAHCIQMAHRQPEQGFEISLDWQDSGGGLLARHCTAIALFEMEQFREAAKRFIKIAEDTPESTDPNIVTEILGHAGLAYYLNDDLEKALETQNAALKLNEENETLLIDRALTYVAMSNYLEAIVDLSNVIILNDRNYEAFTYRGAAYRQLEKYELALNDLNHVLEFDTDNPDALLERAIVYRLTEKTDLARINFLKIIELHDGRPVAEMARANLQKMILSPQNNSTK